jgi:hypothetical protein
MSVDTMYGVKEQIELATELAANFIEAVTAKRDVTGPLEQIDAAKALAAKNPLIGYTIEELRAIKIPPNTYACRVLTIFMDLIKKNDYLDIINQFISLLERIAQYFEIDELKGAEDPIKNAVETDIKQDAVYLSYIAERLKRYKVYFNSYTLRKLKKIRAAPDPQTALALTERLYKFAKSLHNFK